MGPLFDTHSEWTKYWLGERHPWNPKAKSQHKGLLLCDLAPVGAPFIGETSPYDPIVDKTITVLPTRETYLRNPLVSPR